MAFTTPNMGLKVWNLVSDPYDHDQLAANFVKLDRHDHGANGGEQITTAGLADGSVTGTKIALNSITGSNIQDGSITGTELGVGSVGFGNLDSSVLTDYGYAFSSWKNWDRVWTPLTSSSPTSYLLLSNTGAVGTFGLGTAPIAQYQFHYNPGDFAAGSRTVKVRLKTFVDVSAVAPTGGTTLTIELRKVNSSALNVTPSAWYISSSTDTTVVASSVYTLSASSINAANSAEYALTAGAYIITAKLNNALPTNSFVGLMAQVQMRQT
jgi:hypothetical protein